MIEIKISDGTKMDLDLLLDRLMHRLEVAVDFLSDHRDQHAMVELDIFDIALILIALDHID